MDVKSSAASAITTERPTTPSTTSSVATTSGNVATTTTPPLSTSSKVLKRCLSVPLIHNLPVAKTAGAGHGHGHTTCSMTTRAAAAAAAAAAHKSKIAAAADQQMNISKKPSTNDNSTAATGNNNGGINIQIPHSNPSSREVSPAPVFNIFAPRARRYSASYSPHGSTSAVNVASGGVGATTGAPLRLTPRVSQLRQEECVDINSREVNHEREVHSAMQISQSWEDLTLVAENWSCKSDELSNPLQVALPAGASSCSSPSPTSNRAGLRLPYGLSPSPTRRTFATRRSMSPIAMRPSQLGPVKRKFELEENNCSNWNIYSPPPLKKFATESRGSSPICQSPSSVCPSPDSGTYDGRITPKLFISKLCTTNTNTSSNSACSSPMSTQTMLPASSSSATVDSTGGRSTPSMILSPSTATSLTICGGSEPMSINAVIDEGISISDIDEKSLRNSAMMTMKRMSTDMQDETTLMDDNKSETSSIGGCSSISTESSFCESGNRTMATSTTACFLNKFMLDDGVGTAVASPNKNFIINKQGFSGPKKFIVNHDNLANSASSSGSRCRSFSRNSSIENMDCINNQCETSGGGGGVKMKKSSADVNVSELSGEQKI